MGADIENRLLAQANCASPPEDELLREAAAEIGRLRGEVKTLADAVPVPRDPKAHQWNDEGETCLVCGDKDWMGGPCSGAIAPADAKGAAPAMPNGVDDMHDDLSTPDLLNEAERIAVNQHKDGRYAAARILRILCHRLGAASNRDAAGVDSDEDAYVIDRMGKLLAEISVIVNGPEPDMTRWSYHDLPEKVRALKATPAAVPAGEAVADALIEAIAASSHPAGEYQRSDIVVSMHAVETALRYAEWDNFPPSPKESPQPADGEAVAWIKPDWQNPANYDGKSPVCTYPQAGWIPLYTTPPAPVQAAPQEGEAVVAAIRFLGELETVGNTRAGDIARGLRKLVVAAHPSACELGAVREALEAAARSLRTIAEQAGKTEGLDDMMNVRGYANSRANVAELALQHRGDSRGGEVKP